MKKILIALTLVLSSASAVADPTVFGMHLGKTTTAQLKSMYQPHFMGKNKYSNGDMYTIPTSQINFRGLEKVNAIFNSGNSLVAVIVKLPKSKFDYLNKSLGKKYKKLNQNVPFVGNKSASFKDGNTKITLNAPHMSFTMSMNYIRDSFENKVEQIKERDRRRKQKNEGSQL